ncbi:hypothetical protein NG821_09015 [Prevotella cerevisiae]|jgi:hypothetical protein|uniref:Uncharacterized protein n=1 Tax=Segatella cerevisiae TaxID=2053716 RepID=A0ABT1BYT5_9BACT|nr:hypothetical protein [Segatella cerevisiae]MCO6025975.1 hypothetical protein [Segatella cerevisiae]
MQTKTRVLDIRLTIKDEELFRKKAKPYQGNMSAMIRDAVAQFDDRATIGKIDALTDMMKLYRKYQQDLSWLGGNFNQAMKQANEIAISGKLSQSYYEGILIPKLQPLQSLLQSIKDELSDVTAKLSHG